MSAAPESLAAMKAEIQRKRVELESLTRVVASLSSDVDVADIRALLARDAKELAHERDFEEALQKAVVAADQIVASAEQLAVERAVDEPVTKKPKKFIETSDTESDDEECKRKQTIVDERKAYAAMEYLLVRLEAFTVARAAMFKYELSGVEKRKIVELARVKATESSDAFAHFEDMLMMHEKMTRSEWNAFVASARLPKDIVDTKADAALTDSNTEWHKKKDYTVSDDEDDDAAYENPFANEIHVYLDIVSPFSKSMSHICPENSETKDEYKAAKKATFMKQLDRLTSKCKKRARKGKQETVEIYKHDASVTDPILVDTAKQPAVFFDLNLEDEDEYTKKITRDNATCDKKEKSIKPVAASAAAAVDVKTPAAVTVPRRIAPVSTVSNNKRKAEAVLMCVNHPAVKAYHEDLCATCRFDQVLDKVMSRSAKKSTVASPSSSSSSAATAAATC